MRFQWGWRKSVERAFLLRKTILHSISIHLIVLLEAGAFGREGYEFEYSVKECEEGTGFWWDSRFSTLKKKKILQNMKSHSMNRLMYPYPCHGIPKEPKAMSYSQFLYLFPYLYPYLHLYLGTIKSVQHGEQGGGPNYLAKKKLIEKQYQIVIKRLFKQSSHGPGPKAHVH